MPIFPLLLLFFFSVPLLEIYLLLKVGSSIGVLWTIFMVVLTAVIGSILIRVQGFSLLMQSRQQLAQGQLPTEVVFSGACLLVAGALLLTPGFFTDALGFTLLVPLFRTIAYKHFVSRAKTRVAGAFQSGFGASPAPHEQGKADIIEGEFSEEPDVQQDEQKKSKKLP